jgi:hypothetical protein
LPRDLNIEVGDTVTVPDIYHDVFGVVTTVVAVPAQAFSTILFKTPVNLNELRWVVVDHTGVDTF